jgi:molecular chaperone GrpE
LAQQKYSNSRLISKILPMMEDLDLALAHAANDSGEAPAVGATWLEGVKLIQRKFASLLESEGVTVIESVGAPFNPLEHEALGTEESTVHSPGYVTQTVRRGYRLHDRIIQPAQVIVAREPQDPDDDNGENKESDNG